MKSFNAYVFATSLIMIAPSLSMERDVEESSRSSYLVTQLESVQQTCPIANIGLLTTFQAIGSAASFTMNHHLCTINSRSSCILGSSTFGVFGTVLAISTIVHSCYLLKKWRNA